MRQGRMQHDEIDIGGRRSCATHDGAGHEGEIRIGKALGQKPFG